MLIVMSCGCEISCVVVVACSLLQKEGYVICGLITKIVEWIFVKVEWDVSVKLD